MLTIDLAGKRVLITGAASGIGAAAARMFSDAGADLVLVDVQETRLCETVRQLDLPREPLGAALDIGNTHAVDRLVQRELAAGRPIDIVINNAGIRHPVPLDQITDAEWQRVMDTNLKGAFNVARALFVSMCERGWGRIINVSSINAKTGGGILSTTAYAAAKAGVLGLTKGLARDGAPHGILVNAIAPGLIDTPMTRVGVDQEKIDRAIDTIPLKRAGRPEEVASVMLFLASPLAAYMTGSLIHVNGGLLMAD